MVHPSRWLLTLAGAACFGASPAFAQTLDSATAMRYALALGRSYAIAVRLATTPGTNPREHAAAQEGVRKSIARRSQRLSIAPIVRFDVQPRPTYRERFEEVMQFTPRASRLGLELATRHGDRVASLFRFGYSSLAGSESISSQADLVTYLQTFDDMLARAGLSSRAAGFVARRQTTVSEESPDQVITAFHRQVLQEVDGRYAPIGRRARNELAVWTMGRKASLAALGAAMGAARTTTEPMFLEAQTIATGLTLELPPLPTEEGEKATRTAIAFKYVMDDVGNGLVDVVTDELGVRAAALLELAVKLPIVLMMYEPTVGGQDASASMLERTARDGGVPTVYWAPVVASVRQLAPQRTVQAQLRTFMDDVGAYLEGR